jgi:cyclophilin family peptidyl-prolyl cis-trans isomerase
MKSRLNMLFAAALIFGATTVVLAQGSTTMQKSAPAASASFDKALLTPSALNAKAPETFDVKFSTTVGDFVVHVTRSWSPNGADRFYNLVKHHYYDGAGFYRVLGFMAQFGFSAYPQVNTAWDSATIKDDPVTHSSTRGRITYASPGVPNSRSTQLFISYKDNSYLDKVPGDFGAFGEVISGMDVVDKIYSGYGETPDQSKVGSQGKAYLEKNYPNSTFVKSASLIDAAPAASSPKP